MRQWIKLLKSLSVGQRVALAVTAVAVVAGLFALTRWRRESDFRPLYTELEPADAAALIARLKESGSDYRLSEDGRTISVPSARVAELRLSMAAAGLPRNGRIGFELFDKTTFGASEFTEQVNYARALEGELERSVASIAEVEQARVHLTFPKDSVFTESRQPAKASVLVKLRPGARLSPQSIQAVCYLVASAVQGLTPEAVSVIGMDGSLLNRPRKTVSLDGQESTDALLEYRQSVERDLLQKINTTLEPLLGPEKFRASISVECDFTSGEQSEETFDPTRSVMVSSQTSEDSSGTPLASGVPGTASNLPRPTSRPSVSQTGTYRRMENITYESSRVVRRLKLPVGSLRRLSAAVLVDHDLKWTGQGPAKRPLLEPPSPERLKAIHDIVAGVIGFNADRGDQLIVESLPFDSTLHVEPMAFTGGSPSRVGPSWLEKIPWLRSPLLITILAAASLLLGASLWLVVRKFSGHGKVELKSPPELGPGPQAEAVTAPAQQPARELPAPPLKRSDTLTESVKEMVKQDPEATAQVIRTWLVDEGG